MDGAYVGDVSDMGRTIAEHVPSVKDMSRK